MTNYYNTLLNMVISLIRLKKYMQIGVLINAGFNNWKTAKIFVYTTCKSNNGYWTATGNSFSFQWMMGKKTNKKGRLSSTGSTHVWGGKQLLVTMWLIRCVKINCCVKLMKILK